MIRLYTLGHSNRTLEALLQVLAPAGIETLVDVRARPRSGRFPHFNAESLERALAAQGRRYRWAGRELGGMRQARSDSRHAALGAGLRGYADYMDTAAFQRAAAELMELAARAPTAILCAERDPSQCHRSLISDYMTLQGVAVWHLLDPGMQREHVLRPEVRDDSAGPVYDRQAQGELGL